MNASTSTFQDTSEDCAICLSPLSPSSTPCLTLSCGHIYHTNCLHQQLRHARPDPARRLTFSGCVCAKCSKFCDHPELTDLTAASKTLQTKVDALIHALQPNVAPCDIPNLRKTYAFYLCSVCEHPFFGGTTQCAEHSHRHIIPPQERVCPSCSLHLDNQPTCTLPAHAPFHVWKCRLCCNPCNRVCFGRTHFCESCHQKFSGDNATPATPCPGRPACVHPLPPGSDRHVNGPDPDCEQLLFCALCRSNPPGGPEDNIRLSRNLLYNPAGEHGTSGWTHLSVDAKWITEQSEMPFPPHTTNFVSTYELCAMAQAVDLNRFARSPHRVCVRVSAKYMARTDCPSRFTLEASLLDDEFKELVYRKAEELVAPAGCWEEVGLTVGPIAGGRWVVVGVRGKDDNFWDGRYGSKMTDCRVCVVLGDAMETDVMTEAVVESGMDETLVQAVQAFREERVREFVEENRRRMAELRRRAMEQLAEDFGDGGEDSGGRGDEDEDEDEEEWFDGDGIEDRINPEWDEEFRRQTGGG